MWCLHSRSTMASDPRAAAGVCTPGTIRGPSLSRNMALCTSMMAVPLYAGSVPVMCVTISRSGCDVAAVAASASTLRV